MHVPDFDELIRATIERHVARPVGRVDVERLPVREGISGVAVHRVQVRYATAKGEVASISLVLKQASRTERRLLDRLQSLPTRHVPWNHTFDLETDGPDWLCMQDLGESFRPHSLAPMPDELRRREAAALADIHAAHLGTYDPGWIPYADRAYFAWAIEEQFFRPHWEQALARPAFRERFGTWIEPVERAAATIVDEMTTLASVPDVRTLIHTDLNPSNVIIHDGEPYIIDWGTAHIGPLYLDLPHHFPDLDQAEIYRVDLAERGFPIEPDTFAICHRTAATYTALRYIWWTLDAWPDDPDVLTPWVLHYLGMLAL